MCACDLTGDAVRGKGLPSGVGGMHASAHVRPAPCSQVVIQSQQEKDLKKFYRKEEKKMTRHMKGLEAVGVVNHAAQLQLMGYDPTELRKERYGGVERGVSFNSASDSPCVCIC